MSTTPMAHQRFRQATLILLLTLVTTAWGGVVSGHEHLGIDHEHCHVCLLPQMADAAPESPVARLAPPASTSAPASTYNYSVPVVLTYQSRAPPA